MTPKRENGVRDFRDPTRTLPRRSIDDTHQTNAGPRPSRPSGCWTQAAGIRPLASDDPAMRQPREPRLQHPRARGIRVCEAWLAADGFANFLTDMGPQPFPRAGLRRVDSEGHFEPGNVEWGYTRGYVLTYMGRTMALTAWAAERGVPASTLRGRLRRGWSDAATLTGSPPQAWNPSVADKKSRGGRLSVAMEQ